MHGDETSPETQAPKCFAEMRNRRWKKKRTRLPDFLLHFTQNTGFSQLLFDPWNLRTMCHFSADLSGPDFAANNKLPDRDEPDFQECVDCPAGRGSEFPGKSSSVLRPLESSGIRLISFRRTDELLFGIKIDSSSVATYPGSKVFVWTVSRKWRNWQTRTLEGRVGQPMQVQVLSCAIERGCDLKRLQPLFFVHWNDARDSATTRLLTSTSSSRTEKDVAW